MCYLWKMDLELHAEINDLILFIKVLTGAPVIVQDCQRNLAVFEVYIVRYG